MLNRYIKRWFRAEEPCESQDEAALAEVKRVRHQSSRLSALRSELRTLFQARACLVVGSAPDATMPNLGSIEAVVCINGSGWTAQRLGLSKPTVTVVSSRLTRPDHFVRQATVAVWAGLETHLLLVIAYQQDTGSARTFIEQAGMRYDTYASLDAIERAAIVGDVCGMEIGWGHPSHRVSNGIFTAMLPIWAGAREVILAGFSIEGGHAYIDRPTKRGHAVPDAMFLTAAGRLACPVRTTSESLHRKFQLPLVGASE